VRLVLIAIALGVTIHLLRIRTARLELDRPPNEFGAKPARRTQAAE